MINKIKEKLATTKLFRAYQWVKFTHQIGLSQKYSNPSSPKTKQLFIKRVANRVSLDILVETGTYLGDMVNANLKNFKKIYSIELDKRLYERARKRFGEIKNVEIIHGDSPIVLEKLTGKITKPALFWLDAHYSGGITAKGKNNTPIERELKMILGRWKRGSVIVIDDARLFTGNNDYPKIATVRELVLTKKLKTEVIGDMILIR